LKKVIITLIIFCFSITSISSSNIMIREETQILSLPTLTEDQIYLKKIPNEYKYICLQVSQYTKIPVKIIYNLIQKESEWRVNAYNKNSNGSYDVGLVQVNSDNFEYFYWKLWEHEVKPNLDYKAYYQIPEISIWTGFLYLQWLLDYYDGDMTLALTAYNCGLTKVKKNIVPESTKKYVNYILTN